MDRTSVLQNLFKQHRPEGFICASSTTLTALKAHPTYEAACVVSATVDVAIRMSRHRIEEAVRFMDSLSVFVTQAGNGLLLSEAELVSASTSIKEFMESIKVALEQVIAQSKGGTIALSLWRPRGKNKNMLMNKRAVGTPSAQLLEHYKELLGCLSTRVGQWRLKVSLCREDLALYKNQMFTFARCGVLSCEELPSDAARIAGALTPLHDANADSCQLQHGKGYRGVQPPLSSEGMAQKPLKKLQGEGAPAEPRVQRFGMVIGMSSLMDVMLNKATDTVKMASGNAISLARTGLGLGVAVMGGEGTGLALGHNPTQHKSQKELERSHTAPLEQLHFHYTEEEESQLREQNQVLLRRHQESSAQDALEVECSVRELSQLTSLMNEKVMQQSEQFSILVKNTEEVRHHVQRSVEELLKPNKCFWNPTRQLIALLWMSSIFLLVANWIVR